MIAKAGIIIAAAAASLLAVSPLAFAGDYDGGNGHHSKSHHSKSHHDNDHKGDRGNRGNGGNSGSCDQNTSADNGRGRGGGGGGLLNISGNAVQVPVQACNNNILNNIGLGILGSGRANQ